MLHVDHHPSPLSKNSNKNDILWSHQKPFTQDFLPQRPDTPPSPTSIPDGNSTSPTRKERTSSLSPLTTISPRMALAEEKEAPLETPQREEEEEEDPSLNIRAEVEEEEEQTQSQILEEKAKDSRQSTPLSELSPPPDDEPENELAFNTQPTAVEFSFSSSPRPLTTSSPPKLAVDNTRSGSSNSTRTLRSMSSNSPTHNSHPQLQPQPQPYPPTPQQQQRQVATPSTSSSHSNDLVTPATTTTTPALLQDPKVVSILEVNVELLKVCMFFQSKGVPTSDVRFGQYAQRLQSNLTWLAAAADQGRQGNRSTMPFPIMDAPAPVALQVLDAPSAERISRMYAELPAVFAKEILRRQQSGLLVASGSGVGNATLNSISGSNHVSTTPTSPPDSLPLNHLKRERSDDGYVGPGPVYGSGGGDAHGTAVAGIGGMMSNKRRDTGEGKMVGIGMGSPPSSAGSGSSSGLPHSSQSPSSAGALGGGGGTPSQQQLLHHQQQHQQNQHHQQQQIQNMQQRDEAMMMPPPSIPISISGGSGSNTGASGSGGGINMDLNMNPTITGGTTFSLPISMNGQHQSSSSQQQEAQQQQQQFMAQQQLHQQHQAHQHQQQGQGQQQQGQQQFQQQIGRMQANSGSAGGSSRSLTSFSPSLMTSGLPPTSSRNLGSNFAGSAGLTGLGGAGGGLGPGLGVGSSIGPGPGGSNLGNSGPNLGNSNQNELLTLPGSSNPINATEAQMAASVRERARQAQIRMAQQQAHAQQGMGGMGNMGGLGGNMGMGNNGMAGGNIGGMGNMSGVGNMGNMGGMGGNMGGMGGNIGQGMGGMQQGIGMQRQMSPSHGGGVGGGMHGPQGQGQGPILGGGNAIAGPSNLGPGIGSGQNQGLGPGQGGGVGGVNQTQLQQAFQILNTPGHPVLQYLIKTVPGFESMPLQQQVQKMMMSRTGLQNRQDQQHLQQQHMAAAMNRAAAMGNMQPSPQSMQPGGGGMGSMPQQQQNHMGGSGAAFGQNQGPGQGNPVSSLSPVQHQGSNMQGQMFSQGMGMGMGGSGSSGMAGMGTMDPRTAMGNMGLQQQRQLLLMQQQQRAANGMGGGGGGGQFNIPPGQMGTMMMNQQQQQQLAFQRQQQQGQGQGPMNSSSSTHPGSPMVPSDFSGPSPGGGTGGPPMRPSSTIPGIARGTRSPSDGAPSPLMPRGMPTRVGQEEYQRMMLQQQHGQAVRAMASQSPPFNQHQQMMAGGGGGSSNWSQQGGGSNYGMSPSDNTSGFGGGGGGGLGPGLPSPTNNGQTWNTATQGGYPFAPSPSASDHVRNMSATPAPQQQNQATTHDSPSDQIIPSEFDLFNWNA